jgi:hypothetical protein
MDLKVLSIAMGTIAAVLLVVGIAALAVKATRRKK